MMPKYLQIKDHLSLTELEQGYRQSKSGITRSHYQIIWLLMQGKRSAEVSQITGYSVKWIREIVRRYNEHGVKTLGDQRQHNMGRTRLLTPQQEADLEQEVNQAYEQGQPYTGLQVAQRMSELTGQRVYPARGTELLRRWGQRRRMPRPRHIRADPVAQTQFKKN